MKTMPTFLSENQIRGFSLLELLVVITLLGLLSLAAVVLTESSDDQMRYEDTKTRLERIKRAIIGDTSRTVNGEPDLSGFVADMGRLPNCVQELIEGSDVDCSKSNSGVAATPFDLNPWSVHTSGVAAGLGAGWRGPYLDFLRSRSGTAIYLDGWGHKWSGVAQSLGKDGLPDGSDYDFDSGASLVASSDWEVLLSGWSDVAVEFKNTGTASRAVATDGLVLMLNVPVDGTFLNDISAVEAVHPEFLGIADFPDTDITIPSSSNSGVIDIGTGSALVPAGSSLVASTLEVYDPGEIEINVTGKSRKVVIAYGCTSATPCQFPLTGTTVTPNGSTLNFTGSGTMSLPAGSRIRVWTGFGSDPIPMSVGKRSLVVVCTADSNLFEGGTCGTSQHRSTHYFKAVPRAVTPVPPNPLIWEIN